MTDLNFEYSSDDSNEEDINEKEKAELPSKDKDLQFLYNFKAYSHKTTKVKNKSKSVKATSKASSIFSDTVVNDSTSDHSRDKYAEEVEGDNNEDESYLLNTGKDKESKRLCLELLEYNNPEIKCDFKLYTEDKIGIPKEWQYPLIKKSNNYDEIDSKEKILFKGEEKIIRDLRFLLDIFRTKKGVADYFPQYKRITFKGLKLK